jgi:cellulose synthase/poly-beta-1,6-N-acetylglucosamine synthase-like glycosyltransferase
LPWLVDAMVHLSPAETDLALKEKIVAFAWMPNHVMHGVATEHARRKAERYNINVVGQISLSHYRTVIKELLGPKLLMEATYGLARRFPWASARQRLSTGQGVFFALLTAMLFAGFYFALGETVLVASLISSVFFILVVGLRCLCLLPLPRGRGVVAPLLPDDALPVYSVLVPLFGEVAVVKQLTRALLLLDYPTDKLDIKLILEENDHDMHKAVADLALPEHFDVIVVPQGKPQTKPRALNYALKFARGEFLTIYDSEDIPMPSQLRHAVACFGVSSPKVGCLQARLGFYNPNENWLTRQFTAEYAALFAVLLPTLSAYKLPLLLGGTSNHFRMSVIQAVGGWDPFNVTEDADLGIRMARFGYRSGVLDSTTYEEANTEIWNWMKQRRRWLKGFLQTWLVHNRNPIQLLRDIGISGFLTVQCMTLGIFLSALLHPILLGLTFWGFTPGPLAEKMQTLLGGMTSGLSLIVLIAGYSSAIAASGKGLKQVGVFGWSQVLLTIPLYWLLISCAAWMALWDFVVAPFHWHKTKHGLSKQMQPHL